MEIIAAKFNTPVQIGPRLVNYISYSESKAIPGLKLGFKDGNVLFSCTENKDQITLIPSANVTFVKYVGSLDEKKTKLKASE